MTSPLSNLTQAAPLAESLRVLLVEDDAAYARYVQEVLHHAPGLDVVLRHVSSLMGAEEALAAGDVDLILLDIMLSDGNGCEWLAQRKQLGETLPIVVLSSVDSDAAVIAALGAGAQDYLFKPACDPSSLARAMRYAVERHHYRGQLHQTGRRFRHLLENAMDLIAILEPDGSVIYASPAAERLLGVTPDVLIGARLWEWVHVNDILPLQAMLQEIAADPHAARECEFRVLDGDGAWHTLEARGRSLPEGPHQQILINARDVTARRHAEAALQQREQELRQAQKMEAIGRLAGGVAHDFSNVLTVILGATERLLDRLPAGEPLHAEADSIRHAAERAVDLTLQLLTFSRRQVLAPTVIGVADVLGGVGRFLRPLIGEDVALEIIVAPAAGWIRADRTQFEQVLVNLAINGRDAMPHGGRLTIAVSTMELDGTQSVDGTQLPAGVYVLIRVVDTGVGMDPQTLARAFEPFFTTKGPNRGTGIGLATVYGIVSQSGGAVTVSSEVDRGTTVTVYFPQVGEPAADGVPRVRVRAAAGGTETVLVVEDESEVRELVRDMLELAGYTVLAAELPHVAEQIARDHDGPIHLLLTDVVMPEASGREVAKRVQLARPATKVLFMSGYPEYPGSSDVPLIDSTNYVAKPFDRQGLLARVRDVLDEARA